MLKIRITKLKLPVVLSSGSQVDIQDSQYNWRKALSDWYEKINRQFDCVDRHEREKVLDILVQRRDMKGYALVVKERELRAIHLNELQEYLIDGWALYGCKHNQREDVQMVKTNGLPSRKALPIAYKGGVERAIAIGDRARANASYPPVGTPSFEPVRVYWSR